MVEKIKEFMKAHANTAYSLYGYDIQVPARANRLIVKKGRFIVFEIEEKEDKRLMIHYARDDLPYVVSGYANEFREASIHETALAALKKILN